MKSWEWIKIKFSCSELEVENIQIAGKRGKNIQIIRQSSLSNSQQTGSLSPIRSLRSFTYLQWFFFFFLRRVKTPEHKRRCRTGRSSMSSLFSRQTSEATRQLTALGCITLTGVMGAREPSGRAGSWVCRRGWSISPGSGDKGTGTQGEGLSRSGALLEGFFASPSLNESNP